MLSKMVYKYIEFQRHLNSPTFLFIQTMKLKSINAKATIESNSRKIKTKTRRKELHKILSENDMFFQQHSE